MRDNFYDWKVSIQSEVPLHDNFHGVVRKAEKLHPVYFEGFQGEWVFGSYNQNPRQFSVEIQNDYDLYAFILIVTDALRQK